MFPRIMRTHLLILGVAMLAGCGTKTPLSLPPGPVKPPVLGLPAPATPVAAFQTPGDDNNKAAAVAPPDSRVAP